MKLRGYSASTIDVYARAVRRLTDYFDCIPDQLSVEQLETYFAELVDTRSWATVRVDRNGLQFFWKFILKQDWRWLKIIKPPKVRTLPDVLSVAEVQQLIDAARIDCFASVGIGQMPCLNKRHSNKGAWHDKEETAVQPRAKNIDTSRAFT